METSGTSLKVSHIRLDPKIYATHSMRVRGAIAAANAGPPDRLFQILGRWASSQTKDRYVKDALSQILSVSEVLFK
jgi:hypothetical protein